MMTATLDDGLDVMATPPPSTNDLATLAEAEARRYAAWGNEAGRLFAATMTRLAQLIAWTGATTAAEHAARMEAWEDQLREAWEQRGRDTAGSLIGDRRLF